MKRAGHIYEQMAQWKNIVDAENIATKRKNRNVGVMKHIANRWNNLVEIQQMVLDHRMQTDEYMHEKRISGQDKLRDIAKLRFHPSHIEHQLLTMAGERRVDKSFIRHTYASRKGYGQIACALRIKKNLRKYRDSVRWYGQGDIRKYYENISHCLIRSGLERIFKDKEYINAFLEPFERFSNNGKRIPLGIRPSQIGGNLVLSPFDHYMTEKVKAEDYVRYLDDFLFTGATKGEVKRKMKMAKKYLNDNGFSLHEPKIHRISEGVDMMGFVFYGVRNDMWWRKSDKKRWLTHRSKVSNPKRLRELDDAALGMVKWGNRHCKYLWCTITGREIKKKEMGISYKKAGIQRTEHKDANGVPFIDDPKIGMQMLLGKPIESNKWIGGIKTSQGDGRYAVRVFFMGSWYKVIINSVDIKMFLQDMTRNKVTRFKTVFIDRGSMHFAVDEERTEILEVDGRKVIEDGDNVIFEDNREIVNFS